MRRNPYKFETKPFEVEAKLTELKRKRYLSSWNVQQRGGLLIYGNCNYPAIFGGMGEYVLKNYGPHYVRVLRDRDLHLKALEATEVAGYPREICASMRFQLGQLYLDMAMKDPDGNPVKPDFIVDFNFCTVRPKTGQIFAEAMEVPAYLIDIPDHMDSPHTRKYLASQFLEVIEFMEKHSGKKCDDEKLLEAVRCHWLTSKLWGEIILLMRNVPTPLDIPQIQHFARPLHTSREKPESVEFYEVLRDECKERIAQGVSARGYETARLSHEGIPPMYDGQIMFRCLKYGAVIAAMGAESQQGIWDICDDGTYVPRAVPWERGMPLNTREDAAMAMADFYCASKPSHSGFCYREDIGRVWLRDVEYVKRAKDWNLDGVILEVDRGCHQMELSKPETQLALRAAGFPTMSYETNQNDPREYVVKDALANMDAFMQTLGLEELPIEVESGADHMIL